MLSEASWDAAAHELSLRAVGRRPGLTSFRVANVDRAGTWSIRGPDEPPRALGWSGEDLHIEVPADGALRIVGRS